MKVKIKKVNDLIVCDEHMRIMIIKKPKRRYRTIVRAFYKRNYVKFRRTNDYGKNIDYKNQR